MNIITITDLIPQTKENREIYIILYKIMKDCNFVGSVKEIIKFAQKTYFDSWNRYCRDIYCLEGKSKKFYSALIKATGINTKLGVDVYLSRHKNQYWWTKPWRNIQKLRAIKFYNNKYNCELNIEKAQYLFDI